MKNRIKFLVKLNGKTISRRSPSLRLKFCNLQITHCFWQDGYSLNVVECTRYNYARLYNRQTLHEDTNRIFSETKEFPEPKDGISIVEFFCNVNELNNLYAKKFRHKIPNQGITELFNQLGLNSTEASQANEMWTTRGAKWRN